MTRYTKLGALLVLMLMLVTALALASVAAGCGDEAPAADPGVQLNVPPIAPPAAADDPGPELTRAEQQALKQQFKAEAAQEITAENAEAVAAQLEREIDAELAAE
jgi:hypothetical protein